MSITTAKTDIPEIQWVNRQPEQMNYLRPSGFRFLIQGLPQVTYFCQAANINSASQFVVVGYKGSSAYDAGIFYCPYVPLQMVRAIDPTTFQPKIGFKTRYGMVSNPFVTTDGSSNGTADGSTFTANTNHYFRRMKVTNLL